MEDRITVIEPNGVRRSRPLTQEGLTIGRGSDSDLVISYTGASRHHARVMFDGANYHVIDLGSTNGTFLNDSRLAPNVPEKWTPDQTLRIGDISFQLEHVSPYPQQAAPGQERATGPDHQETRIGWGIDQEQEQKQSGASRLPLILAIVAIALCLIAAAVAAAYFLL